VSFKRDKIIILQVNSNVLLYLTTIYRHLLCLMILYIISNVICLIFEKRKHLGRRGLLLKIDIISRCCNVFYILYYTVYGSETIIVSLEYAANRPRSDPILERISTVVALLCECDYVSGVRLLIPTTVHVLSRTVVHLDRNRHYRFRCRIKYLYNPLNSYQYSTACAIRHNATIWCSFNNKSVFVKQKQRRQTFR